MIILIGLNLAGFAQIHQCRTCGPQAAEDGSPGHSRARRQHQQHRERDRTGGEGDQEAEGDRDLYRRHGGGEFVHK